MGSITTALPSGSVVDLSNDILIDDFHSFDQEIIFHLVNYCILNNLKILITSPYKINDINLDIFQTFCDPRHY